MTRDRTARSRIRQHLAEHGTIDDRFGLATRVLKDAVDYVGSPVTFIQLLVAMERDGELVREIRGKRTYRIASVGASGSDPSDAAAVVLETPTCPLAVDYDVLARSLLRELTVTDAPAELEAMRAGALRAGALRIARERDEYARRLELARAQLDEPRGSIRGSRTER